MKLGMVGLGRMGMNMPCFSVFSPAMKIYLKTGCRPLCAVSLAAMRLRTCSLINFTSCLSFYPYSALHKQLHSRAMRLFVRLDYGQKIYAIL